MSSKYFVNDIDLSTILNLNPNSTVNLNTIFNGVDLSNNALDTLTNYYFDTSSNLQNVVTHFNYQNSDIVNHCYPKNYVEYTTSQSNITVPSNLIYGIKVFLIGGSGGSGGGGGASYCYDPSIQQNSSIGGSSGGSGGLGYWSINDVPKSSLGTTYNVMLL